MSNQLSLSYNKYKKIIEPIVAIAVLLLLIYLAILLYQDNQLKQKIAQNCGYETKNYICYCEKTIVDAKQIEWEMLNNPNYIPNVTLAS